MRRDMRVDDVLRLFEGARIADAVFRVRVDEIFLRLWGRVRAVVDGGHRTRGHAGAPGRTWQEDTGEAGPQHPHSIHSSGLIKTTGDCSNSGSSLRGWMQSPML